MKKSQFTIIVFILLMNTFVFSQRDSSRTFLLNNQGYAFYNVAEYDSAVKYFKKASFKDPLDYTAQYNLACTYALLTTIDTICNFRYFKKAIASLSICYNLDSLLTKQKVSFDKDFDGIRGEYEFNVLIHHLSFKNPNQVHEFIVDKTFTTALPSLNNYYPVKILNVKRDGTYKYIYHKNSEDLTNYWYGGQKGKPPEVLIGTKVGKWSLIGYSLYLTNESGVVFKVFLLKEQGVIGEFHYPNPNDNRGVDFLHSWKWGKCGCFLIDEKVVENPNNQF